MEITFPPTFLWGTAAAAHQVAYVTDAAAEVRPLSTIAMPAARRASARLNKTGHAR